MAQEATLGVASTDAALTAVAAGAVQAAVGGVEATVTEPGAAVAAGFAHEAVAGVAVAVNVETARAATATHEQVGAVEVAFWLPAPETTASCQKWSHVLPRFVKSNHAALRRAT